MPPKKPPFFVESAPRSDGSLSIVRVEEGRCVLSTGEELLIKFDKQQAAAEWACQQQTAIAVRTWIGRDGIELIDWRPVGEPSTAPPTDPRPASEESF